MRAHVKRRAHPAPGSIPAVLDIFRSEVRFYQEIAPVIGIRVPACYQCAQTSQGTVLVLEDLSAWQPGADPVRPLVCCRRCTGGGNSRRWCGGHGCVRPARRPIWWRTARACGISGGPEQAVVGRTGLGDDVAEHT